MILKRALVLLPVVLISAAACVAGPGAGSSPELTSPPSPPTEGPNSGLAGGRLVAVGPSVIVVSDQALSVVMGRHLRELAVPAAVSTIRTEDVVAVDQQTLLAAVVTDPQMVAVRRSSDAGTTWTTAASLQVSTTQGVAGVSIASNGSAIAILGTEVSGSNFSHGVIVTSTDNGATWTQASASAGGRVYAAGGLFWLIGGVRGDVVQVSSDGKTWRSIQLPVPSGSWSAGMPTAVAGLGVVFPVTTHTDGGSSIIFLSTADAAATWKTVGSIPGLHTEVNSVLPVAIGQSGNFASVSPDGSKVVSGTLDNIAGARTISPNGLPGNVYGAVVLSPTDLVAIASPDFCPSGKASCSSTTELVYSADGGQTWSAVT